jgi:hypothetical protein
VRAKSAEVVCEDSKFCVVILFSLNLPPDLLMDLPHVIHEVQSHRASAAAAENTAIRCLQPAMNPAISF